MKKLSILLIIAGLCFLGFGGFQLVKSNLDQNKSLAEAQSLLEESKKSTKQKPNLRTDDSTETQLSSEDFYPSEGETVGILHIPRLESDLPIIEGTHEDELAKGVGHYAGTAYPQQSDQIVLSGHRDTVFRRMGELELGDILTVQLPYGDFSYEIVETKIVDADDRTVIVPTAPDEVLTVTTCYPFSYVGNAPDRYIITALPVSKNE
ncbi:class D sortase [Ornithinibacillus halophilus]|uniref:Sortase A n=1 Tax=Ornithinibacillus halophilus TaxID=930117 RepID=A0A1M5FDU7_9BACI|nr:class D sortase [Ornithinibacillus halophilus]SHF89697.1 sortase A [Ornithinibacillus halophilus]